MRGRGVADDGRGGQGAARGHRVEGRRRRRARTWKHRARGHGAGSMVAEIQGIVKVTRDPLYIEGMDPDENPGYLWLA